MAGRVPCRQPDPRGGASPHASMSKPCVSTLKKARETLASANVAMTALDYVRALTLAEESHVDALLAETKAKAAKAQRAADELREGRRVLRDEMDRKNK